jgi:hypothetical protein
MRRRRRRRPGVFLGLNEIAGHLRGVADGLRELGVPVMLIDLSGNRLGFPGSQSRLGRLLVWTGGATRRSEGIYPALLVLTAVRELVRLLVFAVAAARCKIFIYSGCSSFYELRELRLLRRLGKTIIFQTFGSDIRPAYMNGAMIDQIQPGPELVAYTRLQKERMRIIEAHAHVLIAHPPTAWFAERPFVPYLKLGTATPRPPADEAQDRPGADGRVRLLHCPTKPTAKGTPEIRRVVERLRESGVEFDYTEVIGKPNAEVRRELVRCDLVVDQLYSDSPLAGLATEAAWYGRPALVAGYMREEALRGLSSEELPPTVFCSPEELQERLHWLIEDRQAREDLGRRVRDYVSRRLSPARIASRYLSLAADETTAAWFCDPYSLGTPTGVGFSPEKFRLALRTYLEAGGPEALQLDDKPAAREALINQARASSSA